MIYPKCEGTDDCRFEHEGEQSTLMYSPITYDREGKPVGGGRNKITKYIRCNRHGRNFHCTMTEFEWVTDVEPKWKESNLNYGVDYE